MTELEIGETVIGENHPCFVIAEAGVNHNGSIDLALQMIDAAFEAGADAVKFQTFRSDALASATAPKAKYQMETTAAEESQFDMLRRLELSADAHRQLFEYCARRKILFLSTPFDHGSVQLLNSLPVAAFKISSGDLTNLPLLKLVAQTGRPMIISTGMAYLHEVEESVAIVKPYTKYAILHCVSNYPTDPKDVNLRAMKSLADRFDVPVGYSDHTLGIEIASAAVALGATIIEKHFTLDRDLPGPDHRASLEPNELRQMVQAIRKVEDALGSFEKKPVLSELPIMAIGRKSLHWQASLEAGEIVLEQHVSVLRPGNGIPPGKLESLLNLPLVRSVRKGEMITPEDFGERACR